jgi:hypothetical protein
MARRPDANLTQKALEIETLGVGLIDLLNTRFYFTEYRDARANLEALRP